MFAQFQRIRVISLPARADRRREMRLELQRFGLASDPRVAFFDAVKPESAAPWRSVGERGCFESHLAILRDAAGENVLILEDDADFTRAAAWPQPRADILWGGYVRHEGGVACSHCMGFSPEAVKRLVPFLEGLFDHPSPPPIDGAYVWFWRANPDLFVHLCSPRVAMQRPSTSDIAGPRGLDRFPVFHPLIAVGRYFKRRHRRRDCL